MRRGVGELNGEGEAVGGVVIMRWGGNALATIHAVKKKLAELAIGLPDGVEIVETYNRSALIERAVANLFKILGEEFLIVALVCAVFLLHWRSSLVIILTLPLGILAALHCHETPRRECQYHVLGRYCHCYWHDGRRRHRHDRDPASPSGGTTGHA